MIRIETLDGQTAFAPGEPIDGVLSWYLDKDATGIQVSLIWYTAGRGTQDASVIDRLVFDAPPRSDAQAFSFVAPLGPYSCSGQLLTLQWAIEAVIRNQKPAARLRIVIAPDRIEREPRKVAGS